MTKSTIIQTINYIDQDLTVSGSVVSRRDHGKISFLDIKDMTGILQVFCSKDQTENVNVGSWVTVMGKVAKRPEKLINPNIPTGSIELQASKVTIINLASEMPFDMYSKDLDLQLPTLLDYRSLTLRHPKVNTIFKVQSEIIKGFRQSAQNLGCVEVFPPTISASSTEGGAEVLKVDYFGNDTFLVQSPQLYKQILVGAFERVFLISHIYRAEPSVTTRHLVESIQMDCEISNFENFESLLDALENTFIETISHTHKTCKDEISFLGATESLLPNKVPRLKMREAQAIIKERTGVDHTNEPDLMPEDEREICKWAREVHGSDLVTITHFPTHKRAFYTKPDPKDPEYSLSYDLLYKGLEISSGSQRVDSYDELVLAIKKKGMDPKDFGMYLQAFKYSMPIHGGFSYGLERTTMKLLELENIRQASLFPRDMERVDFRFSDPNKA